MGDLVLSEGIPTRLSSKVPVQDINHNSSEVSDPATVTASGEPAAMKSESQDYNVTDSNEEVYSARDGLKNELKTDQTILEQGEKPERNTATKSATLDSYKNLRSENMDDSNSSRVVVDTTAPIESVRDAVSKFGGIADWKSQRVHTLERRRHIDEELEKIQEEMILYTKRTEAAEDVEMEVMNELKITKKQISELELQLSSWSSQTKEQSHDSDHSEVNTDAEITIQELIAELVTAKASLHAAQVAYNEAEEKRTASIVAFEEEKLSCQTELNQIEGEVERLKNEYLYAEDLKSKLESASALLSTLKSELANYIGSKMKQETADAKSKFEAENSKMKFLSAKKELEQVKVRIDKATTDVGILKLAASSLQSELDREKESVSALKKQIDMAMVTIQSLEEELSLIDSEKTLIETRKKHAREIIVALPVKLQQVSDEADQAKNVKESIREELRKAREEAKQVKAEACTMETRLRAAEREIDAAKASESLALAAIHGLQESETSLENGETGSEKMVIISLEEYQMLSYSAQEAEERAKTRLAAALIQIEAAKKSESKSLQKLEELSQELSRKKSTHSTATQKSGKALNEKLNAEQELRSWRTRNEQRRKASKSASFTCESSNTKQRNIKRTDNAIGTDHLRHSQIMNTAAIGGSSSVESDSSENLKITKKKKKRSLFPTLLKFFGRRKSKSYTSKKVM